MNLRFWSDVTTSAMPTRLELALSHLIPITQYKSSQYTIIAARVSQKQRADLRRMRWSLGAFAKWSRSQNLHSFSCFEGATPVCFLKSLEKS